MLVMSAFYKLYIIALRVTCIPLKHYMMIAMTKNHINDGNNNTNNNNNNNNFNSSNQNNVLDASEIRHM